MVFESCQISSPASTPTLQAIATRRDRKAAIRHTGNYKAGAKPSISSLILRSQSIDKDCGKYSPAGSKTETQKSSSFPRKMEKHWYSYAGSCDLEMEDNSSDVFIKKEGMYLTDSGPLTPNAMDHCDPLDIKPAVFSIGFNSDLHEDMMWDQKSGAELSGMTYREIRLRGNFSEAESTLRGRFRTLTKNKEWRVRKPHWFPRDIDLLREGVEYFCDQRSIDQGKIPWKRVAEYILQNGGSYLFGNATCRKKWDEMMYYGMF
ncbi:hypothetical protein CFO_g5020 [Ceratocystis platani]|uniref:Myb-like domain-containing protein n=1 Tax=Ceratocystis fimbriata f. sp. platani TaxID=88771 RepID=A0A0F8BK04_CERFI|nr:hypothetical protein CFO_g5020 [Ceratocystis platani]